MVVEEIRHCCVVNGACKRAQKERQADDQQLFVSKNSTEIFFGSCTLFGSGFFRAIYYVSNADIAANCCQNRKQQRGFGIGVATVLTAFKIRSRNGDNQSGNGHNGKANRIELCALFGALRHSGRKCIERNRVSSIHQCPNAERDQREYDLLLRTQIKIGKHDYKSNRRYNRAPPNPAFVMTCAVGQVSDEHVIHTVKESAQHGDDTRYGRRYPQHVCVEHDHEKRNELQIQIRCNITDSVTYHFFRCKFLIVHNEILLTCQGVCT